MMQVPLALLKNNKPPYGDLVEAYKYSHGLYKAPEGILELETLTNTTGHGYKLKKLHCNTSMRQYFFSL
jgi:hypothetical protein